MVVTYIDSLVSSVNFGQVFACLPMGIYFFKFTNKNKSSRNDKSRRPKASNILIEPVNKQNMERLGF